MLSALKNFGVTFLIALLVFAVIGYFATLFVTGTVESILKTEKEELSTIISDSASSRESDSEDAFLPVGDEVDGESFTLLLVTTDYLPEVYDDYILSSDDVSWYDGKSSASTMGLLDGDYRTASLSTITMVRANKETGEFVYVAVSPFIRLYTTSGNHTLSEIYYIYGMGTFADYVATLTGMDFDYTFLISGSDLSTVASLIGDVQISCPKSIYSDGRYYTYASSSEKKTFDDEGNRVTVTASNTPVLSSGTLYLSGDTLYTVLSVKEHSNDDVTVKETVVCDAAEGFIKGLASLNETTLHDTLDNLINRREAIYTDFPLTKVSELYDLFSRAASYKSVKLIYPCEYKSKTSTAAEYFRADRNEGLELLTTYRNGDVTK